MVIAIVDRFDVVEIVVVEGIVVLVVVYIFFVAVAVVMHGSMVVRLSASTVGLSPLLNVLWILVITLWVAPMII